MFVISRAIKKLVGFDFTINFAFGLLSPIFAVFVIENIQGSTLKVVGLSAMFYWIARVLTTIPFSRLMDRLDGERDEFYFIIIGAFIISTIPLFYLLARFPWHIYIIQFVYGVGNSMTVPAWRILFTDHIDRGKIGFEWSLDDVAVGLAVAISAYIGSFIADKYGFETVIVILSILGYVSTLLLLRLGKDAETLAELRKQGRLGAIREKRKAILP
ncbi:MAG: hypothetical protein CEN90_29 [Parcubacteria group bacterium Licking1014_17]|nr:MAG: hypothetical protein CEN90_29 [Parcubacteria group bacterium Licking1014_17]